MKLHQLPLLSIVLLATALSSDAQITRATVRVQTDGTTSGTVMNRLEVPSGEVWELLQYTGVRADISVVIDGAKELSIIASILSPFSIQWTGLASSQSGSIETRKPLVVGPAGLDFGTLTYPGETNFQGSLVYRRITNQPAPPAIPSNTVVIPSDAAGPVEIILESSVDLVNWTRAEPGEYGASTEKRFFRLRAVAKP